MEKTFIFGHKKPDTDSITASIALSYLKNQLGELTEPRILGDVNRETEYVLNYFNVSFPKYLNDVKLQIKDLDYKKDYFIESNASIMCAYKKMMENTIGTLPVIDENDKFIGIVSMKDIAKNFISETFDMLHTSYQNILDTLKAKECLYFNNEIKGKIRLASYKSTSFIENVHIDKNTILIVGDRHSVIEYAIKNNVQLIIITGDHEVKEEHLKLAKENKVNIIYTPFSSFQTARYISFCNFAKTITLKKGVITTNEYDYVNDFIDTANKTKYSVFPVLNDKDNCLGIARLSDLSTKKRKKVILVDHNEQEQSVEGLEEAEIIEIVDHHKLGTLGTTLPINFRNMPVGSTNTIIYQLYQENEIKIPKEIAGLMLSGILSDTLLMQSPTTTELDVKVITELSNLAEIDYQSFGIEMFKAGTSLKGKTKEDILYSDFKNFTIGTHKIGVGQIFTLNIDEIFNDQEEYIKLIESVAENNDYTIVALFVTDIIKNGSYIFFNQGAKDILDNAFEIPEIEEGTYLQDIVSRKKQVIPNIMRVMEQ